MAKESPQIKLEKLQLTLQNLQARLLPDDTQADLNQAIARLAELPEYLVASEEQMRLAALYRVSQTLGTSLNLDEVLTQAMDAVISLTSAERGFLMLLDPDTNHLQLRAARNIEHETLERESAISRTVIDTVMKNGKGVVTTNAQTDPRFSNQDSVMLYALRSILCAPLLARGQAVGVIYVDNRAQSGLFTKADLDLLNAFATQAAIAIENARLYVRTDQALNARVAELETLTQIDRELNARLDFDHIMEITYRWAVQGTGADQAWIALLSEESGAYQITAGSGDELLDLQQIAHALKDKDWQTIVVPPGKLNQTRLAVSIIHARKPIGIIIISGVQSTEKAAQFLPRLAARGAIAIENTHLYDAIQQANLAKTKFISVITHELRIPMTAIKGYADLLRQQIIGPINEQQQNFLDIIRNNVVRMASLVSDLSDISRIETGRLKLDFEWLELRKNVEETLNSLQPKIKEKSQTVEVELLENTPQVFADPNRVVQILTNLLSNASKYTPPGGSIHIRAVSMEGVLKVEVSDTGIGIRPEDKACLFEQFFRSDDPAVREQQGWGLGLSVTQRLVELMNGVIGVESEPGKGSKFWFTLPTKESSGNP